MLVAGCVVLDMNEPATDESNALRPSPKFPGTDAARGNEGWVLVTYGVSASGLVIEPHVAASTGRPSFERAALKAIRKWRYMPGEERHASVLVIFAMDNKFVRVSGNFRQMYEEAHTLIDGGNLDAADTLLDSTRNKTHSPYEIAYIYTLRGRVAGHRGDLDRQLQYYRQAMLHEGRWLDPGIYRDCLKASVILAIILEDYVSAVRDYELLASSGATGGYLADLQDSIKAARIVLEQQIEAAPFSIADTTVAVTRGRKSPREGQMPTGPPSGRGATPPPSGPRNANQ
jgi:TonB family protein